MLSLDGVPFLVWCCLRAMALNDQKSNLKSEINEHVILLLYDNVLNCFLKRSTSNIHVDSSYIKLLNFIT